MATTTPADTRTAHGRSAEGAVPPTDAPPPDADRPVVLVWLDAREAVIVRRRAGLEWVERLESDVPRHHRSTGHVRHDPAFHGGGGRMRDAGEPHRLAHLERFLGRVARRLPPAADVVVLGPGVVHERLAGRLRDEDARQRRTRSVTCQRFARVTPRQLVATARSLAGDEPRRTTVGAYRWSDTGQGPAPRRVAPKPPRSIRRPTLDRDDLEPDVEG